MDATGRPRLGARFRRALRYAAELHEWQIRKKSRAKDREIPYLAHLLGVASLVIGAGGSEDEAIAALLHDALEDQPRGAGTERRILRRFGPRVLEIVKACTKEEAQGHDARLRAEAEYVRHLKAAGASVQLVAAADKLHNARAIVADLRSDGEEVWMRFNKTREEALAYYRSLAEALGGATGAARPLAEELGRTVEIMLRLAGPAQQR
jgi:(p)ppGpp synthase/HD superfamily hydrolase